VDVSRIFGKFITGAVVSYAMSKGAKNTAAGQCGMTGTYVAVGLDIAGTLFKYWNRNASPSVKLTQPIMPQGILGYATRALGFGQFHQAAVERGIISAIQQAGRIEVMGNEKGEIGLMNPSTGKIILSGPERSMQPVLAALEGIMVRDGVGNGDREEDQGIGEAVGQFFRGIGEQKALPRKRRQRKGWYDTTPKVNGLLGREIQNIAGLGTDSAEIINLNGITQEF
jgi:hypothetical protein